MAPIPHPFEMEPGSKDLEVTIGPRTRMPGCVVNYDGLSLPFVHCLAEFLDSLSNDFFRRYNPRCFQSPVHNWFPTAGAKREQVRAFTFRIHNILRLSPAAIVCRRRRLGRLVCEMQRSDQQGFK